MPLDLHGLAVHQMVVHEIRKGVPGAGASVILTDQLSELTPDLAEFFEQRIISVAASEESFRAQFSSGSESPVPQLCVDVLETDPDSLLTASREAALHLASVQPGSSSGGLLAVALGQHSRIPALIFLKLEHEQGVRIDRKELPDGTRIVELEHVRDLILSTRTRLHKQAFVLRSADGYVLEVADRQRGFNARRAAARFFIHAFLGAEPAIDSREATKRFVEAVESVISEISDPKRQTELRLDLASELNSRKATITPSQFAQAYLETEEIPLLDAALDEKGAPPQFEKDNALVGPTVSRLRMIGANGMMIAGPPSEWVNRVTVGDLDASSSEVNVTVRDEFRVG
ncbi:MAG: nucleoid-associated protein [Chloroflexi bacterium]|nr:nucleoid-associated protein [Chloroflexota bacterium]